MAHGRLHGSFEFCVMHRLVFLVPAFDGSENVSHHLRTCQHTGSARPRLPQERLRVPFPAAIPFMDERRSTFDSVMASEVRKGMTTDASTVLPEHSILEGGSVLHHDVAEMEGRKLMEAK